MLSIIAHFNDFSILATKQRICSNENNTINSS